jgi:hypothetical protein
MKKLTEENLVQDRAGRLLMQALDIQSFSYDDRTDLLPILLAGLADGGGWVLDRRTVSASMVELKVEAQLRSVVDLYGAIIAAGLELTRTSHLVLTDLCTCRRNAAKSTDLSQLVTLRIEVSFLEDITLHSLLASGGIPV